MKEKRNKLAEQAMRRYDAGNLDEAIALLTRAIREGDRTPIAYRLRALCCLERGESLQALNDLAVAIEWSTDAEAYLLAARANLTLDRFDYALRQLDAALRLDPRHPEALAYRSLAKVGLEDPEGARRDAERALTINPDLGLGYFARASSHLFEERFDKAVRDFTKAVRYGMDPAACLHYRGIAQALAGRDRAALADLNASIRENPADPEPQITLAAFLYATGDRWASLRAWTRMRRIFPVLNEYALAWICLIVRDPRSVLRRARAHHPLLALVTDRVPESELIGSDRDAKTAAQFELFRALKHRQDVAPVLEDDLPHVGELVAAARLAEE